MQDSELLRRRIEEAAERHRQGMLAGKWWHSIDLGGGRVTPGVHSLEELSGNYARFGLPDNLRGKRLLDVGCWDGFYSFEAERRGAEVVAVDVWQPKNFFVAHRALGSRVQFYEMSVYDLTRERLGTFDYVLFIGVLYHLRHPLLGLERLCEVTRDTAIIETHVIDNLFSVPEPVMQFYEFDELGEQYDNWWGPNSDCALRLARSAGFATAEVLYQEPTRLLFKASRRWPPARLESEPSIRILKVLNSITDKPGFPCSGPYAFFSVFVEALPADATRETIRLELGGFGLHPTVIVHQPGYTQINAAVPPGVPPGPTRLRVLFGERCSPEATVWLMEGSQVLGRSDFPYAPLILEDPEASGRPRVFISGADDASKRRPARRGVDAIEIFCTGLGPASRPPQLAERTAEEFVPETLLVPLVTLGGVPADVLLSSPVAGSEGLYCVTVQVPAEAPAGEGVPVVLRIGGAQSNTVTIAVE